MKRILLPLMVALALTGCTTDKVHSWMRADPAELSDFLPERERLVRQPDTSPFHYFWCDEDALVAAKFKNVHIAPVDTSYLREGKAVDSLRDKIIGYDDEITSLAEYARKAYVKAFEKREERTGLKVVDSPDVPQTLVIEPAIIAFVPTRAVLNALGIAGSFVVPGVDLVTDYLATGLVVVECRVRDSGTKKVVAMYADTENDPNALIQVAKLTFTSSAKINIKRIAEETAECCAVGDYSKMRRSFPFEFITLPTEASLE